jgi:hypothetical protein
LQTFLHSFEERLKASRHPPDIVFVQIDGGAENVAKTVLAMMELLIAHRVTKKIVLCRLPVGHTHEDIDAMFAKIWKRVRNSHVLTVAQYMKFVHQVIHRMFYCDSIY